VGKVLADTLGATEETPEAVAEAWHRSAGAGEASRALEAERSSEWISVIQAGQALSAQLATTEATKGGFAYLWRPAMSWLIIAIIGQSFMVAPWLRSLLSIDVGTPYDQVLGISAVWLTIYGGGHTVKSIFGARLAR